MFRNVKSGPTQEKHCRLVKPLVRKAHDCDQDHSYKHKIRKAEFAASPPRSRDTPTSTHVSLSLQKLGEAGKRVKT